MHTNEELIYRFYTCFQTKDFKGMQACYADNATFSDAVFKDLNATQVKAMWEMLCKTGKDLTIEFKNTQADDTTGSTEWIAYYTFSRTGNKVANRIKASFTFEQGKIVTHIDDFNFYSWAKQAFGTTGLLLGWTPFLKNKIRQTAMRNLDAFMLKNA